MSEPKESAAQPEARMPVSALLQKTADEVRRQPVKSLVWSFFVGIFLTIIPVGRILSLVTSVMFGLLRPVLLMLGLVKVSEILGDKNAVIRGKGAASRGKARK